ncbi:chorismate-binding protein [Corynebacterium sp. 13CS0277]|uniref:chorismate-binding protein n=1 Tax=Corynebacterium sp. 13CS0277 TaxID=2071994 RepID=UPI0013048628|nr:chorismate-binding protein [Corynebacterium sp. 13CS0277]
MTRIVLIDNHDSFTHLLADLVDTATGCTPEIIDRDTPAHLLPAADCYVISPGPGHPADELPAARAALASGRPVVGVCLGHQLIAYEAGAVVDVAAHPMHGQTSPITYRGRDYQVTRYHSLAVTAPPERSFAELGVEILGRAADGTIMALRRGNQVGLQFHPESFGTIGGAELLADAIVLAMDPLGWARDYPFFAWLEFEGTTRLAAGHEPATLADTVAPAGGEHGDPLPVVGAMQYEATGLVDGSEDVDAERTALFHAEQFLTLPLLLPRADTAPDGGGQAVGPRMTPPQLACTREEYEDAVRRAQDFIRHGHSYELCLTTRATSQVVGELDPVAAYQALRAQTPAPMAGLLITPEVVILSASPERFVDAHDGVLRAQPIKGTRPRGATPAEDAALREELAHSTKDHAENLMIVDVLRNDLHRSCAQHSITVPEQAAVYSYPRVHQMVSTIRGQLTCPPAVALLRAFPGGSMTGAPKQRSMEILHELEGAPRGFYSGVMGYVAGSDMDVNMLIRTIVIDRATGVATYGAGGAVTRLSDPAEEFAEVLVKMQPFMVFCGARGTLDG